MKILAVFGTRPEAIKMCPLILELKKQEEMECKVCLTGQHEEMLKQVMESFQIVEDYNLHIMRENQTLTSITALILQKLEEVLLKEKPDVVLVHGDTTTSFAAALAAFYQKIPVGHVEAGLRSGDKYSPYPEEINRCLTGKIATYHFAPTKLNEENLLSENINSNIYITGNTVIDAFKNTVRTDYVFHNEKLLGVDYENKKIILITAHRRENLGEPLKNICHAIKRLVKEHDDVIAIYPVHLNPKVRAVVYTILEDCDRVMLIEPLDVLDMHNLLAKCHFVMTDSGGLQEEAPAFGKPVLVMRTETERPEAIAAGTVRLVGVNEEEIYNRGKELLTKPEVYEAMAKAVNPYGDGIASQRIVKILLNEKI